LQIMEEGQLTDARGKTVNFRNAIIIMTSNVGADLIKRTSLGFDFSRDQNKEEQHRYDEMKRNVEEKLRLTFIPEFLNRVDATITFRSLSREEIKQIVDLELRKVSERLLEHAMTIDLTESGRDWLALKGYDPEFGARSLRRLIQNEIEDRLSDGILT